MVVEKSNGNIASRHDESALGATSTTSRTDHGAPSSPSLAVRRDQLFTRNAAQQRRTQELSIPQMVAIQAAATPDAVAVVTSDSAVTYAELNRRANRIASRLQRLGVGPEVLVGVCLERSIELIASLLGILKAGGAYLPLDPDYPCERLSFMLENAHASVLLTRQRYMPSISAGPFHVICLDTEEVALTQENDQYSPLSSNVTDLAYVIYTSGSTGQPKGVQITHAGLLNLVHWHQQAFAISAADRATQLASPAFDATGWEIWPYLTLGAQLYLPNERTRATPTALRDWLVAQQITVTFLPTPLAELLMMLEWPATVALRVLLTGADTLHKYPPAQLPFVLVNNYGPTECTVVATSGVVSPTLDAERPPPIGRPIANVQIYILDDHLHEVPAGLPGDLYIGGVGLARGYLNRPDLTAERFIQHPFSDTPGARLYKTGDLACCLPDGQVAFLGRADDQIKIRGYRIEPEEIVAILNKNTAIQANIVVPHQDAVGEKHLVAFIVLASGAQVTASSLRNQLAVCLPDYMIPEAFVVLEALPMTPNGKVDRAALPVPDASNTLHEDVSERTFSPVEQRVARIIAEVLKLKVEQIDLDDNFFLLGGHSLLGTQVIARIVDFFGVALTLRTLFDAPTVRLLSREIERSIIARLEAMSEEEVQRLLDQ